MVGGWNNNSDKEMKAPKKDKENEAASSNEWFSWVGGATKTGLETAGAATAGSVDATKGATVAITAYGFTKGGVAAGSMAVASQAAVGNVAAGSTFAALQSIGTTGGFAVMGSLGVGAAAVVGTGYLGYKGYKYFYGYEEPKPVPTVKVPEERLNDGWSHEGQFLAGSVFGSVVGVGAALIFKKRLLFRNIFVKKTPPAV